VLAVTADGTKKATTMEKVLSAVAKDAWKENGDKMLARFDSSQKCYRDGENRLNKDGEVYDGYAGMMYVTAKNKSKPTIIDQRRELLTEADNKPYSGCYVNAKIEVYANTNAETRGVFATLLGVQFVRDGDRFGGGGVADAEDFDEIDIEDAAADDDLL